METIQNNNRALADRLLDVCNPENIPVRVQSIADHIAGIPDACLSQDEIDQMVQRIFRACRGEDGRPRPDEETGQITIEVTGILASHIRERKPRFPEIKRMSGNGSFA